MTKHDTWVKLKSGNPYELISEFFPDGIPMRDPFPMEISADSKAALWIVDLERLSSFQANALAHAIAANHPGVSPIQVAQEAVAKGGFAVNNEWVEGVWCGSEGIQRTKELADFFQAVPNASHADWQEFYNSQYEQWIEGDKQPQPINSIDDVDPRLRTSELEKSITINQINSSLAGYSVFDVLSGQAMIDVLNQIDPDNKYSLFCDEDWDDENE